MSAPIDFIEDAIVDLTMGRITRDEAIATVMSVLNVTALGAANLLDHPVAPLRRYDEIGERATQALRELGGS